MISRRGSALLELLLSLSFTAVLAVMTSSWTRAVLEDSRKQQTEHELQEEVALALATMASELRTAGYSNGTAMDGIASAGGDRIELHSDFDGDGEVTGSHERILYARRSSSAQLTRASGQGGAQALVDHVPTGGFELTYFDATGAVLSPSGGGLSLEQRRAVTRVDLRLRAQQSVTAEASLSVRLRNGPR